eukprot:CAMPEP_0181098212 /NCGR_PEP_ID=MMETSP1071-20121207/11999_1 /TAXON_ID=35127 /ORGANISM="Thalassiosira sp., Strain NH16" /LENGTH=120 /DNA_ID=CAMNT_0023180779 /DNA_START=1 /DNA_END=364 /DNA_ORIENTATION=+
MSMPFEFRSKSAKLAKGAKSLKEPIRRTLVDELDYRELKSSTGSMQERPLTPFLIDDFSTDMDESMSMELFLSGKSHKATFDMKENSAASKSSKDEVAIVVSKSRKEGNSLKPSTQSIFN